MPLSKDRGSEGPKWAEASKNVQLVNLRAKKGGKMKKINMLLNEPSFSISMRSLRTVDQPCLITRKNLRSHLFYPEVSCRDDSAKSVRPDSKATPKRDKNWRLAQTNSQIHRSESGLWVMLGNRAYSELRRLSR